MLKQSKGLFDLGFSIIVLQAKSKKPVENGWTKGPRKSWDELKKSFKKNSNLGVRLGKSSKLKDGSYLAVIDCDVKSKDPKHLKEMSEKLETLVNEDSFAPRVMSGRGNGSMHIYVKTDEPARPFRFSQSNMKVKVHMPSVRPTPYEKSTLKATEIAEGIRLRPAWEISVMGEGQQVVLPGSIHPDSGKPYKLQIGSRGLDKIPKVKLEGFTKSERVEPLKDFKPVELDIELTTLPERVIENIVTGDGITDGSAALYGAAIAMRKHGFKEIEVLSVLTNNDYFLGGVAYRHTQSHSRGVAANWVKRHTLAKVEKETNAAKAFNSEAIVEPKNLSKEDQAKQAKEILGESPWQSRIQRDKNKKPMPTLWNIQLILNGIMELERFIAHNEFSFMDIWLKDTPWNAKGGKEVSDVDIRAIKNYFSKHFNFEPAIEKIDEALMIMAHENKFHPVKEYIEGIEWDGVNRLDTWLTRYLGAKSQPKEYLKCVGAKVLTAMVARIYEPAIKFEYVLILEGLQGAGKSSAARILSDPWFSDSQIRVDDKDAVVNMQGIWVYELGELSTMTRSEVNAMKQFISVQTDRLRLPYGHRSISLPRKTIFIGTTNDRQYLKDKTGNRRYWPVKIKELDRAALIRDRDQLMAEARLAYECGETLYPSRDQEPLMTKEQSLRVEVDELEDHIKVFLAKPPVGFPKVFQILDLIAECKALENSRNDKALQTRLGPILRDAGFDNPSKWDPKSGKMLRKWRKK